MFCDQCGAAVAPGAKFCEECGAQADRKVSSGIPLPKRIRFLGALSLVVVLAIGTLFFFVGGPSSITERENLVMKEARKTGAGESPRIDLSKSPETARRELGQMGIQYSEEGFIKSVKNNDTLAVGLFLAAGMNPNVREGGETALMIASVEGRAAIVQALLDKGADVNAKFSGRTALMGAAQRGHTAIVQALLDKGADVNAKGKFSGRTALMEAAQGGHTAIVQALLEKGAGVNTQSSQEALMLAVQGGHADTVQVLLAKGADVNAKAIDGSTALMWAARGGYLPVVQVLLAKGADVNAKAIDGSTALMWAVTPGESTNERALIVQALLATGADVNTRSTVVGTALSLAQGIEPESLRAKVVKLLEEAGAKE